MIPRLKKKIKRKVRVGIVHIKITNNNTIVTITDLGGNTLGWSSAGCAGFQHSRKSTPYAAQSATEKAVFKVAGYGLKKVHVLVKGKPSGREAAIRKLQVTGIKIKSIKDVTGVPYNGCRPPNKRRV